LHDRLNDPVQQGHTWPSTEGPKHASHFAGRLH